MGGLSIFLVSNGNIDNFIGVGHQSEAVVRYGAINPIFHNVGDVNCHPVFLISRLYINTQLTRRRARRIITGKGFFKPWGVNCVYLEVPSLLHFLDPDPE
jgi:hypothetical protein